MFFRTINARAKDFLLFTRMPLLLKPLSKYLRFAGNFSDLTAWISREHKKTGFSDFYRSERNHASRERLYAHVAESCAAKEKPIVYYEFGVASGTSFRWWLQENKHPESVFYGFDTFEGLPEDWHFFKKGDMSFDIPEMNDSRAHFIKGLFQQTFLSFLKSNPPGNHQKIIHMDADLYSSTLFILTSFAPYLQKGDVILFDEFNVANHEFAAWSDFQRSYYVDYEVLGAVNNFYQIAIRYLGQKF